ncbi:hypothetical protein, partial [Burkholderia sp. BCC1630]|uniref:hypothetical protein n=1 Tax=Burkholderia sp. BCC1630 TaxID=2676304 RepID=UPI001ABAE96C
MNFLFHLKPPSIAANTESPPFPPEGNTDLSGSVVIADAAEDVVEDSSRNGSTTMKRQMSFAEAEST